MLGVIALSYLVELVIVPQDWAAALHGVAVPRLADSEALTVAVGIVGATVMPHAIYLHSGLTQARTPVSTDAERRRVLRFSTGEVVFALGVAGLVNMAMLMMAAGAFHVGHADVAEIGVAYHTLVPLLGQAAAGVFLLSLIASGISSSAVGTLAGQVVMQGFLRRRVPVWPAWTRPAPWCSARSCAASCCRCQWSRWCCSCAAATSWGASRAPGSRWRRLSPRRLW